MRSTAHTYTNPGSNCDAHSNSDPSPNSNTHSNSDTDAKSNSDSNANRYSGPSPGSWNARLLDESSRSLVHTDDQTWLRDLYKAAGDRVYAAVNQWRHDLSDGRAINCGQAERR